MMKCGTFISLLFSAALLWGCWDDSYQGVHEGPQDLEQRLDVRVALGSIVSVDTRGLGTVDGIEDFEDKTIYVYSFRHGEGTSFESVSSDPASLDCLVDGPDGYGRAASASSTSAYLKWMEEPSPRWPVGEENYYSAYDFYAYHLGELELKPDALRRSRDKVEIDLDIDGNTDIMHAIGELSDEDKEALGEGAQHAFSYFTAYQDINPSLRFRHDLAKISFTFVSGINRNFDKTVIIKKVAVKSPRHRATFTVAHRDPDRLGLKFAVTDSTELCLCDKGSNELEKRTFHTKKNESLPGETVEFDNGILVAPTDDPNLTIIIDTDEDYMPGGFMQETESLVRVTVPGGLKAGMQYNIKIKYSGAQGVSFSVELRKWNEGGKIVVDPEGFWND